MDTDYKKLFVYFKRRCEHFKRLYRRERTVNARLLQLIREIDAERSDRARAEVDELRRSEID